MSETDDIEDKKEKNPRQQPLFEAFLIH